MGEPFGTFLHEVVSSSEEIPRGAHVPGVDVGHRESASSEESGDFLRIDLVVLTLAAMDRFHIERMAQDEGNPLLGTQIGEPIPDEHAFDGHGHILPVGLDRPDKGVC